MWYQALADLVVIFHLAFVLFVLFGGLTVLWWPPMIWVHLPAAAWGAAVEFAGWICPLTPLEHWLRQAGGANGTRSDFIGEYVLPVLYPAGLTSDMQTVLGTFVVIMNLGIYGWVLRRRQF